MLINLKKIIDGYYYSSRWAIYNNIPPASLRIEATYFRMASTLILLINLVFLCSNISNKSYWIYVFPFIFNPFFLYACIKINEVTYNKKNRKKVIKYFDKKPKRYKVIMIILSIAFFYSLLVINIILLHNRFHASLDSIIRP